jgi:hypothetical protein
VDIIKTFTQFGPLWALAALAIWCFTKHFPATLRAISSFMNDWRKTSAKIKLDQEKATRAFEHRSSQPKSKKGKDNV